MRIRISRWHPSYWMWIANQVLVLIFRLDYIKVRSVQQGQYPVGIEPCNFRAWARDRGKNIGSPSLFS